jgi:hypothetical protein
MFTNPHTFGAGSKNFGTSPFPVRRDFKRGLFFYKQFAPMGLEMLNTEYRNEAEIPIYRDRSRTFKGETGVITVCLFLTTELQGVITKSHCSYSSSYEILKS